jgi:hypothetical protein
VIASSGIYLNPFGSTSAFLGFFCGKNDFKIIPVHGRAIRSPEPACPEPVERVEGAKDGFLVSELRRLGQIDSEAMNPGGEFQE